MYSRYRERIGAATGAAFVVAIFVGNGLATAGQPQSDHPTGQEVLSNAAHAAASTTATIGSVLEVLGFVLFMFFVGHLWAMLQPGTARSQAAVGTSVVGAITMLAVKLGSAAPVMALDLARDRLDPSIAQVLYDINGAAFVVSWLPFAVFAGSLAVALHSAGLVGRPTQYIGVIAGVGGVAATVAGMKDALGANPMVFIAGMAWLLVVTIRLAVRPGRPATAVRRVPDDAPARA